MAQQAAEARTPGAKRAGDGEYLFDLAQVNHILGGPDYSTANGACVEGDRMIVGLMRMPAGTGAEAHSHPNEQWIYILQGTFVADVGGNGVHEVRIARIKYAGNWNPEPYSWQRFSRYLKQQTGWNLEIAASEAGELKMENSPIAHLTGTGELKLSDAEVAGIRWSAMDRITF